MLNQRLQSGFKSGGVVDPGKNISIFQGKFPSHIEYPIK